MNVTRSHLGVLHIERHGKDMSPPSEPNVTSQTCGHIRAGVEDDFTFSIVAVKVRCKLTNKTTQTYAFLDPGRSDTFCTEAMAKRLNLQVRRQAFC